MLTDDSNNAHRLSLSPDHGGFTSVVIGLQSWATSKRARPRKSSVGTSTGGIRSDNNPLSICSNEFEDTLAWSHDGSLPFSVSRRVKLESRTKSQGQN